jgi:hypothetical protein
MVPFPAALASGCEFVSAHRPSGRGGLPGPLPDASLACPCQLPALAFFLASPRGCSAGPGAVPRGRALGAERARAPGRGALDAAVSPGWLFLCGRLASRCLLGGGQLPGGAFDYRALFAGVADLAECRSERGDSAGRGDLDDLVGRLLWHPAGGVLPPCGKACLECLPHLARSRAGTLRTASCAAVTIMLTGTGPHDYQVERAGSRCW